jgi:hypothetical protein
VTAVLKGAGAVVRWEGRQYDFFRHKGIPDDTPPEVIEILRRRGNLASHSPDPTEEPGPAFPAKTGGEGLADQAPHPDTADVAELAVYIDENNLTAPQTVALARNTAEGARRVLEAEQLASGGDGRATVVKPLTKLMQGA